MEIAAADRDRNFVIIQLQGATYVGQAGYDFKVSKEKVPHGFGYLRLDDGSQHQGFFERGRAAGKGVLLTPAGLQLEGEWRENARIGAFRVVDASGAQWSERYAPDGMRTSRRRLRLESAPCTAGADSTTLAAAAAGEPAEPPLAPRLAPASRCWNCAGLFHRPHNNSYACRRHRGKWEVERASRGERQAPPGVWTCCAARREAAPGCAFLPHALDHGDVDGHVEAGSKL